MSMLYQYDFISKMSEIFANNYISSTTVLTAIEFQYNITDFYTIHCIVITTRLKRS